MTDMIFTPEQENRIGELIYEYIKFHFRFWTGNKLKEIEDVESFETYMQSDQEQLESPEQSPDIQSL